MRILDRKHSLAALALLFLAMSLLAVSSDVAAAPGCNPCGEKKAAAAENPCGGKKADNPCGGKTSVAVNPCHAKMGTVFHVNDPMSRNTVTFTSEAPLEDIIGTTNNITGYVVFDPENPTQGGHGKLIVPVGSLKTGIPLRDEHLLSGDWLAAKEYPDIVFDIEKVTDVKVVKKTKEFATYELHLSGPLTLHGKTRTVQVPAVITYMAESDKTRQKMEGDLLAGRASFEVGLKDFGVTGFDGVVGSKVSESIQIDVRFVATNKSAGAENPCGGKKAMNPCNPCGGKEAKNPCNPCGGKTKGS